jgi:MmyB-like transcription regulator ligand binding domain
VLTELIGELTTRSDRFSALWAAHDVRRHTSGTKFFHHRVVGDLQLDYENLELPGDGLALVTYTAAPGSTSREALRFLASWAGSSEAPATASESEPLPRG